MFCALLKAKLDIEARVINLQKNYLELLSSPVRHIEYKNSEDAKNLLSSKIETIEKIVNEYKAAIRQHHQISADIIEAREIAQDLEADLDNLCEALEIEIPEEFKQKPKIAQLTQFVQRISIQPESDSSEEEENKEHSRVYQQDSEEEETSDKENSVLSNSGEYFSPNIQIQKTNNNSALYTPAVKSSSKLPLFKRQV
jgi:hypothetical protein